MVRKKNYLLQTWYVVQKRSSLPKSLTDSTKGMGFESNDRSLLDLFKENLDLKLKSIAFVFDL